MAVSSEVGEDFFLSNIRENLFEDTETPDVENEINAYVETTFEISGLADTFSPVSSIIIEHLASSSVDLVGLQVWRGALLLADFLLANQSMLEGKRVLELASGTGLTAVVSSTIAERVVATDVDRGDILEIIRRNGARNKQWTGSGCLEVEEIDFFWSFWPDRICELVAESEIILAADVVYDKEITRHFFKTMSRILSMGPKVALIAIEKRLWTGEHGEVIAPNFQFFLDNLSQLNGLTLNSKMEVSVKAEDITFPKYFSYNRVSELTLWRIESRSIS